MAKRKPTKAAGNQDSGAKKPTRKPRAKKVGKEVRIPTATNEDFPTLTGAEPGSLGKVSREGVPVTNPTPPMKPAPSEQTPIQSNALSEGREASSNAGDTRETRTQAENETDRRLEHNNHNQTSSADKPNIQGDNEWRASATTIPTEWQKALTPTTDTTSADVSKDGRHSGKEQSTPQTENPSDEQDAGDELLAVAVAEPPGVYENPTREESQADATRRWRRDGIAEQVAVFRDRVREEYRKANPGCKRRDAHEHAWSRAIAEFPPAGIEPKIAEPEAPTIVDKTDEPAAPTTVDKIAADLGVSGLGDLPPDWPQLPANASLQVEIAWVSANRLRVRSGKGVDLSRALSPAPSYSALSWLETSILFPSKFADISVKATAQQDEEKEYVRRERMAIEEIRGLLAEMLGE